jgi:predicted CXXCH cytochrome family protein
MKRAKTLKAALVAAWVVGALLLLAGDSAWTLATSASQKQPPAQKGKAANPDDYVGAETCSTCHQDQTDHYKNTAHARLEKEPSWKGKVVGCESCHGAGKGHVETMMAAIGEGKTPDQVADKRITRLSALSPKDSSDTCLTCHAGREEHNNYRRGEHWRNDVGCIDCHTSHSPRAGAQRATSNTLVAGETAQKPGFATAKMLRQNEQQLCMSCHTETQHQFKQPFHHKVLEGAMKCSDCHNPHGGFERKQARLASGADAVCVKCHADKQGPFTYEHAPVKTEGCQACHVPHGTANPRMLKTNNVAQLCLECHSQDHGVGAQEPIGPVHNLNLHYRDCTTCHMKVHGSHTSPVFMR